MALILDQTTKFPTSTEIFAFLFFPFIARHPEENVYPSQIYEQPAGLKETRPTHFQVSPWSHRSQAFPGLERASLSAVILWKRVGIAQTLESLKTLFILTYLNLNDT